jgi:hypothetical protein
MPVSTGGQGAGEGNAAGAGSLGNGGTGQGAGNQGAGPGGGGAMCGAVDFEALGKASFDPDSGTYQRNNIVAVVHYADGTSERIPLDWTWHYKTEDDDPFSNPNQPVIHFQFPPVQQRASEPPAVQYIMKNTRADGGTTLNDQCPSIPSAQPQQ